jgi:aminoglycoside phosphotransferase (APT) family kinase protein
MLNWSSLTSWMAEQGLPTGVVSDVQMLAGGTQNILVSFTLGHASYVLRRPPIHKRDNSDETMRREARILAALKDTEVPHPALIAQCPDTSVIGAAFYLMAPVAGFNPTLSWPDGADTQRMARTIGLSMVDAIAALGRVEPEAVGLADFGRSQGWLERQCERWGRLLTSYERLAGFRSCLTGAGKLEAWLRDHRPSAWRPGLIHGDFQFSNVIVEPDGSRLAAIVDWELASIGDPLLDLGHMLATWPTSETPPPAVVFDTPGLPSRDELIERYRCGSSRDVGNIDWYQVLACFRLASILEGSYARAKAGLAPLETGNRLHGIAIALFEEARMIAEIDR